MADGLNEAAFEKHKNYWNKDVIQEFWSGRSFEDQDHNGLSYTFAQILVENIRDAYPQFNDFIKDAKLFDAGESSALNHLGVSLNTIASAFLGEGEWTPNTYAIKGKDSSAVESAE